MEDRGLFMNRDQKAQVFICFSSKDRYTIAEPLAYHLKNYGINTWYDRNRLLIGYNRKEKNLNEGAYESEYAIIILSENTFHSDCAMEEISILKSRYIEKKTYLFPILYEISPKIIVSELQWLKDLIFKEVSRNSGTREVCNHIACKITENYLCNYTYCDIESIIKKMSIPPILNQLLNDYLSIDNSNLNSRITILYAIYINIIFLNSPNDNFIIGLVKKIFTKLFSETKLNLSIDYRETWLLENAICLLINEYYFS